MNQRKHAACHRHFVICFTLFLYVPSVIAALPYTIVDTGQIQKQDLETRDSGVVEKVTYLI